MNNHHYPIFFIKSKIYKSVILSIFNFNISFNSFGQTNKNEPIPVRQVSGIVKDSTNETIIGATITLTSSADTLRTATNEDGIFVFRGVKSWVFDLKVSSIGYITKVISGKYN